MFASLLAFLLVAPLHAADPAPSDPAPVEADPDRVLKEVDRNPDGSCPPDTFPLEGAGCIANMSALVGMKGRQLGTPGTGSAPAAQVGADGTSATAADPIILGDLKKAEIDPVIAENLPRIRQCYQAGLKTNPGLAGRVIVKFVVEKDGTVKSATVKSTTLNDPDVEGCVVAQFGKMRFPAPRGGGIVIVSYPFEFSSSSAGR